MPDLVALALPGGPAFVEALRRVWDSGDAVFPLDLRLPPAARRRVLEIVAPSTIVGPEGISRLPHGQPVAAGDALVVATSGTSGKPKAVVLTHDAVRASARATSERLGVDPERDRWLACLPLNHMGGLSVVTRALLTGTELEVQPAFDRHAVHDATRRGATLVSLVPAVLARIEPSRFRRILLGGAAAPADLPPQVVTTYGLTETGGGVVYDGTALDGVDVRIVAGEIQVRGPMLLRSYRDGADPRRGGWFPTGDLGSIDADGHLHVEGRRDDLIVTGGENVQPAEVERALTDHPGVREVAVAGRPDPEWGHRVVAFVVPDQPSAPPTLESLRSWVEQRLPVFAAPREIVHVSSLPRTPLGKLRRTDLGA